MIQNDFYTIQDENKTGHPENAGIEEVRLGFSYDDEDCGSVEFTLWGAYMFTLCPQQLAELGALFLALSGGFGIDYEGARELLDGFDLKANHAVAQLHRTLNEE